MARTSCLAAVLLVAILRSSSAAAAPSTTVSGNLRWVRGEVTAVSGDQLTLKLRSKPITIALDGTAPPAVGAVVEAHYTDKRGDRRAVLIFDADRSAELSKRPGTSYRGVVKQVRRSSLSITAASRSRGIDFVKQTQLMDADGRALATGWKAIGGLLPVGEDVVVKYEGTEDADQALEIRKLR
jgi:hypothetical protein